MLLAVLCLPLIAALLAFAFGKHPNLRETAQIGMGILTAIGVILIGQSDPQHTPLNVDLVHFANISLGLSVEPLGVIYATVAASLWPVTTLYAAGYLRGHHEINQTRFFVCFCLAIFGALGIAFSANLFTLFFFYEFLTLSTFPLVTHAGNDKAIRAGKIYLGILLTTSIVFLLPAITWTFVATGSTDFVAGGLLRNTPLPASSLALLLALFAFGAGKAALIPFHKWLPNAMVAPTPVSALLHAVAVVKAGVFTILKVAIYIFGADVLSRSAVSSWLIAVACITILVASLIAMHKDNLKARLAYSTISQLAYITLGAALATAHGWIGGGVQIATHALGKITLFFCAGVIIVFAHKEKVSDLNGLGRKMPLTFIAFTLGAFSIIGLPPFGGAWSKWHLALGALEREVAIVIAILVASSLLNVAYLLPIPLRAFFYPPTAAEAANTAPLTSTHLRMCQIALSLTASATFIAFFWGHHIASFLESSGAF